MEAMIKKNLEIGDVVELKSIQHEDISNGGYEVIGFSKGNFTKMQTIDHKYNDLFLECAFTNMEMTCEALGETLRDGDAEDENVKESFDELIKEFSVENNGYNWWLLKPLDTNYCVIALREYELKERLKY